MRTVAIYYALGAVAVAAAGASVVVLRYPELLPPALRLPAQAPPVAPAPAAATPAASPSPVAAAKPASAPAPAPRAEATPAFDIVRVERDGSAVVAGHAGPGDKVELRDADKTLGSAVADDNGQFVIIPDPLAAGAHALRLAVLPPQGEPRLSAPATLEVAASAVPAPKPTPLALAAPAPSPKPTTAATPAPAAPKPSPSLVAASPTPAPAPAPSPAKLSPTASRLAVARVKATEPGRLEAEGEAEPGAKLRLTLNGAYLADVAAGADGRWSLTIEHGMTPGLYALEARSLAAPDAPAARAAFAYPQNPTPEGAALVATAPAEMVKPAPSATALAPEPDKTEATKTATAKAEAPPAEPAQTAPAQPEPSPPAAAPALAKVETPASPEPAPAASPAPTLADASHAVVAQVRTTTVVKGDNLWDLARKFYNDGERYSDIYAANSDQIRNPSLIYIGQVFVVPNGTPAKP